MIFNVTDVSRILYYDSYESYINRDKDEYDEFTLYVVKTSNSQILVYYGNRRLKDTLVVDSYPSLPEYPLNKLYVQVGKRVDRSEYVKSIHYKYLNSFRDPEIVTFNSECFSEFTLKDNGVAEVSFLVEGVAEKILLTIPGTNNLSEEIVNKVISQVNRFKDSRKPSWDKWG